MNDRQDNNDEATTIESTTETETIESTEEAPRDDSGELPAIVSEDSDFDRIAELEKSLLEKEEQLQMKHNSLLRTAADLDNFRKRSRRDVEDAFARGKAEVLRELLPVIDSVDLAIKNADPDGPAAGVLTGVEMVRKQFLTTTNQFGMERIEAAGEPFDPNFHDAVAQVPSEDVETGRVVEEMRPGYRLGERLLRPAMVVVAKGRPSQEPPAEAEINPEDEANGDDQPPNPEEAN